MRYKSAIARAKQLIRDQIRHSEVPEDPGHAENALKWLLRLAPDADPALRLAALAHDIERARPNRIRRQDFDDYDHFKEMHAAIGARITARHLRLAGVPRGIRQETCRLVRYHESGGDPRSDLLKDADSISFFDHNLQAYLEREGFQEALRRATWGYARLSARGREQLALLSHPHPQVNEIISIVQREASRTKLAP